jgi:DNA-binding IclR family transcriptional regulator
MTNATKSLTSNNGGSANGGTAYSVPAIHRTLDIMETLIEQRALTVSDISRQFSIPKSSAYAILQTLKSRGYVEKDADDRYSLSFRLFSLGATLVDNLDVRTEVHSLLEELTRKAGITGHIAIRDGGHAVYIDKVEVLDAVRVTTWVGKRMPLHSTSIGKALLAYLPEKDIDRILTDHPLRRLTPKTITNPAALKEQLAKVRAQGFASCSEENEIDVRSVAAPIFNGTQKVVAAVNLGASTLQMHGKDTPRLGALIAAYAMKMSAQLGYRRANGSKNRELATH